MKKLGEVWSGPSGQYVLTAVYPYVPSNSGLEVWTPIPTGELVENLGHTYRAAVTVLNLEPIQRVERYEDITP